MLWLGAPLLLLIAGGALLLAARRRQRAGLRPRRRSATRSAPARRRCWTADAGIPARPPHHGDGRRAADPALARASSGTTGRLDGELAIYRDQLAEIERERAAGTLPESEAAAARIEIERRILAAGDHAPSRRPGADATLHRLLPPALALAIPLLALGLYLQVGRPGLPAAPFVAGKQPPAADRRAALRRKALAAARARVAAQPDDPDALSALGEALTLEADGTVTPAAVEAFTKALAAQPDDPRALYYLGLHEAQTGDSRAALARWQELEAKSPPDAPFLPMLRAEIARVAKAAGLDPAFRRRRPACPSRRASSRRRWRR